MVSSRKEDKMKDIKKGDRTPAGAPSQIHKNDTLAEADAMEESMKAFEDQLLYEKIREEYETDPESI